MGPPGGLLFCRRDVLRRPLRPNDANQKVQLLIDPFAYMIGMPWT